MYGKDIKKLLVVLFIIFLLVGLVIYYAVENKGITIIRGSAAHSEECNLWNIDRHEEGQVLLRGEGVNLTEGEFVTVIGQKKRGYGDYFTECNPPSFVQVIKVIY
ncbi:MAG: hypothetical protein ACPGO5_02290 [Patescibacteria group bacterium]